MELLGEAGSDYFFRRFGAGRLPPDFFVAAAFFPAFFQSSLLTSRAPSTSDCIFAQTMLG